MRDGGKAQRANAHYQQVRLYADKYGKKPAWLTWHEGEIPVVFIPSEWQNAPRDGLELDEEIEQELLEKAGVRQGQRKGGEWPPKATNQRPCNREGRAGPLLGANWSPCKGTPKN